MRRKFENAKEIVGNLMSRFFPNFFEFIFVVFILCAFLEFFRFKKPILFSDEYKSRMMQASNIILAGTFYSRANMHLKDFMNSKEKINIVLAIIKFIFCGGACVAIYVMYH